MISKSSIVTADTGVPGGDDVERREIRQGTKKGIAMKRAMGFFLIAAALFTTGCAASVGYNRGYYRQGYGGGYRYERDWDGHNPRFWDRHEDRYRHDRRDRYYDRDHYGRYY